MRAIGIIPARLGSQRLKSKPLIDLDGKPVILHVWEKASKSRILEKIFVATDSEEIKKVCVTAGAQVIMTSTAPRSGSDRVAEAYSKIEGSYDLVLNIQGDMPFINPDLIDTCLENCQNFDFDMATPAYPITLKDQFEKNSVVKVIFTSTGYALYFSRSPIPYPRFAPPQNHPFGFKHLGLYVFKPNILMEFAKLETGVYEAREGLEQLRLVENGFRVKVLFVSEQLCSPGIEIDTEEDVRRALEYLKNNS
ncbi:MAG: 3-deoxy-manno-octulosonate cytidylyltransferase [Deltaproteobacteria bacterium]|nr:3-deoxy-manno-octulosonate cytidylyltransferase [Deltaproteobacteria bacterium]